MIRALCQTIRPDRLRITHVIGSLDVGGAERALCSLVASIDPALAEMKIVALIPGGALVDSMRRRGIEVETLAMRPGRPIPAPSCDSRDACAPIDRIWSSPGCIMPT